MVDEAITALGHAVFKADRAIGIECLTAQVEAMCGDLCQRAAKGVSGDGDFGGIHALLDPILPG